MKAARLLRFALAALLLGVSSAGAGAFLPGEILVNKFRSVQRYSAAGALEQTYTGTGGANWGGASLTLDGNLVTTYRNAPNPGGGVNLFDASGTQLNTFGINAGPGWADVSVFANGTLAVTDMTNSAVQIFTQSGTLLNTVSLTRIGAMGEVTGIAPFGSTVGTDNILYVASNSSQWMAKVSEAGVLLGMIQLSFQPGDLVMSPVDGTLWASERVTGSILHLTTDGTVLGSISSGFAPAFGDKFNGIGIAPDGNSLYAMTNFSSVIHHVDLNGNQLGDISIISPDFESFLTVVPNAVPEPDAGMWVAFGLGAAALLRRRRWRDSSSFAA